MNIQFPTYFLILGNLFLFGSCCGCLFISICLQKSRKLAWQRLFEFFTICLFVAWVLEFVFGIGVAVLLSLAHFGILK